MPNQKSLHLSFRRWMAEPAVGLSWSVTDSEDAIMGLRGMMMQLQRINTVDRRCPKKYSHLDRLVDMFPKRMRTSGSAIEQQSGSAISECNDNAIERQLDSALEQCNADGDSGATFTADCLDLGSAIVSLAVDSSEEASGSSDVECLGAVDTDIDMTALEGECSGRSSGGA